MNKPHIGVVVAVDDLIFSAAIPLVQFCNVVRSGPALRFRGLQAVFKRLQLKKKFGKFGGLKIKF